MLYRHFSDLDLFISCTTSSEYCIYVTMFVMFSVFTGQDEFGPLLFFKFTDILLPINQMPVQILSSLVGLDAFYSG